MSSSAHWVQPAGGWEPQQEDAGDVRESFLASEGADLDDSPHSASLEALLDTSRLTILLGKALFMLLAHSNVVVQLEGNADRMEYRAAAPCRRFFSAHSSLALREGEPGLPDVDAARRRRLRQILAHQLAAISVSVLTLHARSQLLLRALGPDRVADVGGTGAFLVALSDLALSPVIGRVSDLVGRRPLMLLLPAVGLPTKLLAACWPRPALLQLDRVLGDSLRTLCGTTMTMTCLADLYHGQRYAAALGYLQTATGLGLALGPMLAAALMGPRGQRPRLCFWAAALVAALHLVLGWRLLEENQRETGKQRLASSDC
ncbi:unnamed protein product [Effrenium voratum]|uniref:Major facilitator superfamily (MFS) profile domain-containing protein n=1 Tax=Effrenium voratum TaxID=2562239 RepID=A0AA36JJY1_9DINO|nr:unnamed protein product [Effrenium voratum]